MPNDCLCPIICSHEELLGEITLLIQSNCRKVREALRKHAERFNIDLHVICEDLRKKKNSDTQ